MQAQYDVLIIGAGAAGLMCAVAAGRRGRSVLLIDHAGRAGRKIQASGGGKCNFSNYEISPKHFLCTNPHFVKSALSRFGVWDFLDFLYRHEIEFEEREQGRLFCKASSSQIVNMLLDEARQYGVSVLFNTHADVSIEAGRLAVAVNGLVIETPKSVVIATGGPAWPQIGATSWGYEQALKLGLKGRALHPALVPLLYGHNDEKRYGPLTGISLPVAIHVNRMIFHDALLFTHHGISGPAALQASNYWTEGMPVIIDLLPSVDLSGNLQQLRIESPKATVKSCLTALLPKMLVQHFGAGSKIDLDLQMANVSNEHIENISAVFKQWHLMPSRTDSLEKAEAVIGGVDVNEVSSKTFECKQVPGLYFIGEVLDVTGWLGGYNLHWAWASGWCAGQYV